MSELSLAAALAHAEGRFARTRAATIGIARRGRADRGRSRLQPAVERKLKDLLHTHDRPSVTEVDRTLTQWCRQHRQRAPSRATIYNVMTRLDVPMFDAAELPDYVRQLLHNTAGDRLPGHQVVFAAVNYGGTQALSYAASLPWICIQRALAMRGFRPKSLALLRTIAICRGIAK